MTERPSVFSRVRLAVAAILVGVGLVGATAYGLVASRTFGRTLGQTLGPYSDVLADHAFAHRDPALWRSMARRHGVALSVELPGADPVAFDERGQPTTPAQLATNRVRAVRTAADGMCMTLYWSTPGLAVPHAALLVGLLVTLTLVVGLGLVYLQRQLRPLAVLHDGVAAVARGEFAARVPVVRDDEIGRVATAFNEMAGRVGTMVADRERLLADVSHELRSPLTRMRVALELVSAGQVRSALLRDVKEMEAMVATLLEREALRTRGERLEASDVDLNALVADVAASCAGRPPGVRLVPNGPVTLRADPALLKLLVHNLVDNALKFSLPESAPAAIALRSDEDAVVLTVADDGIGIPGEDAERVFEPFVKRDPARGHHAGYGLGLDLCRRVVELHGGTIRLVPRVPRGTEAIARLPRR